MRYLDENTMEELERIARAFRQNREFVVKNVNVEGMTGNMGVITIIPQQAKHGEVRVTFYARERELVIVAKPGEGIEFANAFSSRCVGIMPPLFCAVKNN